MENSKYTQILQYITILHIFSYFNVLTFFISKVLTEILHNYEL